MAVSRAAAPLLAALIIGLVIAAALRADAALTCNTILSGMSPCLGYLRSGGSVSVPCCNGLSSLYKQLHTKSDIQAACQCVKTIVPSIGAKAKFVNSLPGICHVNIPYTYSPSIDCSKVARG